LHRVRIAPREQGAVTLTYRINSRCIGGQPRNYRRARAGAAVLDNHVSLRIGYARFFERSQSLELPFALALVCSKGISAPSR